MKLAITDDGARPAGSPDRCFYCGAPKGEHVNDCVCVTKTVVLRLTVEYVVAVPNSWTIEDIEFHRNESSYCIDNDIEKIYEYSDDDDSKCLCSRTSVEYVRDADEDETTDWQKTFTR